MIKPGVFIRSLLIFASLCCTTTAMAILPPFYESSKEIVAILNDKTVAEEIGSGRLIQSIIRSETQNENSYLIKAGDCSLKVFIIYKPLPKGMVGPAVFEIKTDKLICDKSN